MNPTAILLDALENMPEMVSLTIDYPSLKVGETVPGDHDLKHRLLGYYGPCTVERNSPVGYDTDVDRPGFALSSAPAIQSVRRRYRHPDLLAHKLN